MPRPARSRAASIAHSPDGSAHRNSSRRVRDMPQRMPRSGRAHAPCRARRRGSNPDCTAPAHTRVRCGAHGADTLRSSARRARDRRANRLSRPARTTTRRYISDSLPLRPTPSCSSRHGRDRPYRKPPSRGSMLSSAMPSAYPSRSSPPGRTLWPRMRHRSRANCSRPPPAARAQRSHAPTTDSVRYTL
ncbi:hypothetical protein IMSAGC022_00910 [Alistipes sp.]|nr:hypothetical protein IMSAGC022_00910 [Alistipes sp.]